MNEVIVNSNGENKIPESEIEQMGMAQLRHLQTRLDAALISIQSQLLDAETNARLGRRRLDEMWARRARLAIEHTKRKRHFVTEVIADRRASEKKTFHRMFVKVAADLLPRDDFEAIKQEAQKRVGGE